mmetsp:Transcript_39013/g.91867  ORF Transcript_39013/g.91867 Transcript_39013/m.91867 type:complete len:307 (-) Transcript_39013:327-1247(-)
MAKLLKVITLGLGATTAAAEVEGLQGVIQWLKQHGEEVLDTADSCINVAKDIEMLEEQQCNDQAKQRQSVAGLAVWGVIEGLEHTECPIAKELAHSTAAQSAKAMAEAAVEEAVHLQLDGFCQNPQCTRVMNNFESSYSQCYGSSLCAAMAKSDFISYEDCKPTMIGYIHLAMSAQKHMICQKEATGDYFCAQEAPELLFKNPACYVKLFNVTLDEEYCKEHEECMTMWKQAQIEHPACTEAMHAQQTDRIQLAFGLMSALLAHAKDPEVRKQAKHLPTGVPVFVDTCRDFGHLMAKAAQAPAITV